MTPWLHTCAACTLTSQRLPVSLLRRLSVDICPPLFEPCADELPSPHPPPPCQLDLVRFAKRVSGPTVTKLETAAKVEKLAMDNDVAFVLCDPPAAGTVDHTAAFTAVAKDLQVWPWSHVCAPRLVGCCVVLCCVL